MDTIQITKLSVGDNGTPWYIGNKTKYEEALNGRASHANRIREGQMFEKNVLKLFSNILQKIT